MKSNSAAAGVVCLIDTDVEIRLAEKWSTQVFPMSNGWAKPSHGPTSLV